MNVFNFTEWKFQKETELFFRLN